MTHWWVKAAVSVLALALTATALAQGPNQAAWDAEARMDKWQKVKNQARQEAKKHVDQMNAAEKQMKTIKAKMDQAETDFQKAKKKAADAQRTMHTMMDRYQAAVNKYPPGSWQIAQANTNAIKSQTAVLNEVRNMRNADFNKQRLKDDLDSARQRFNDARGKYRKAQQKYNQANTAYVAAERDYHRARGEYFFDYTRIPGHFGPWSRIGGGRTPGSYPGARGGY